MKHLLVLIVLVNLVVPVYLAFIDNLSLKFSNENSLSRMVDDPRSRTLMNNVLSSLLLHGAPLNTKSVTDFQDGRKQAFNWTSCGPPNQLLDIKTLEVQPAPLSLPGPIVFGFDIFFNGDVDERDNITVNLLLHIKTPSGWLKIPCIGQLGSCTYLDLCSKIKDVSCPAEFQKLGIPCHCPFKKGEYKLPKYKVKVDAEVFVQGSYKAQIVLKSYDKGQIGCYNVDFTIV